MQNEELQRFRIQFRGQNADVRVLPEDSLRTFFEKIRDVFDDAPPVESITAIYQELNAIPMYFYNLEDPNLRNLRCPIEHCTDMNPNLPVIVTAREGAQRESREPFAVVRSI